MPNNDPTEFQNCLDRLRVDPNPPKRQDRPGDVAFLVVTGVYGLLREIVRAVT